MFRLPFFGTKAAALACRTAILAGTLVVLTAGNAVAESAYNPVPKRDDSYEMTERGPRSSKWKKLWKWSAAALVAGSSMDVASSWGYPEANGMLRGPSGQLLGRGTAIKFGVLGAALVGQHYLVKKHPEMQKSLAITNFVVGAGYTGVAVRNWRVR